jgi:PAS domain S-box-containing protein
MPKRNILIIHQSINVGEDIEYSLVQAGYQVFITPDPRIADNLIMEHSPDLVLIDEQFEETDGHIVAANIINRHFNLPVIIIVNQASRINELTAAHPGVVEYLPQPLSPELLLNAIHRALDRRDQIQNEFDLAVQRNTQAIKDRLDIIETLQSFTLAVTSSLDLENILKTVVEAAVNLTNAEEGSLLLLEEPSGDLFLRAVRRPQEKIAHTLHLPVQDALAGQVLHTGSAVKLDGEFPQEINDDLIEHPLIYVPIRTQERILGVLGVGNRQSRQHFTDDHLRMISSLAEWAAVAMENAKQYSQSKHETSQLEAILTHLSDGLIVLGPDGRLLIVNEAARTIFGLDEADLLGKSYQDVFLHPDMIEILDNSEFSPSRTEINMEDGRIFNTKITAIPQVGYALIMQDITHLKELDRIKSDFVNTVSHDLRSPLTAILGYVELIARAGPINSQQHEFINRIEFSANNITSLINDLLDLGRIEAGFDIRKELVQIPLIIQYAIEGLSNQIDEREHTIVSKLGENLPPVLGNPVRLRQMINNLVNNAIAYTPAKGCIEISAREESGQIIIHISDNGPGIPLADQPYIFDKFFRGSNIPYDLPGTGLGLAIVQSIVDNHLGRIWVESVPGAGTTFTIVLPVTDVNL